MTSLSPSSMTKLAAHLDIFSEQQSLDRVTPLKILIVTYENDIQVNDDQQRSFVLPNTLTAAIHERVLSISSIHHLICGATIVIVEFKTRTQLSTTTHGVMFAIDGYSAPSFRRMKAGHTNTRAMIMLMQLEQNEQLEPPPFSRKPRGRPPKPQPRLTLNLKRTSRPPSSCQEEDHHHQEQHLSQKQGYQSMFRDHFIPAVPQPRHSIQELTVSNPNVPLPTTSTVSSSTIYAPGYHQQPFTARTNPDVEMQHLHYQYTEEQNRKIRDLEFWSEHLRVEIELEKEAQHVKQRQYIHWQQGERYKAATHATHL